MRLISLAFAALVLAACQLPEERPPAARTSCFFGNYIATCETRTSSGRRVKTFCAGGLCETRTR